MKREELKSLVDIPKLPPASGKRMLQNLESFESMTLWSKFESLRTTAGFFHPVEQGSIYITTLYKEDGWRKCTSLCKEYTKPRNDEDSRPYASIDAYQQIGPILDIGIAKIDDVYGIEVQIQSLSDSRFATWVLICRGHEIFVNESHLHNNTIVNQSFSLQEGRRTPTVDQDSNKPASGNPVQGFQESETAG